MSDLGDLPKLPAVCSQCGQDWWEPACGPTHAIVWQSIGEPVRQAIEVSLSAAAGQHDTLLEVLRG